MAVDIAQILTDRQAEKYALHEQFLNPQMVRVLKTIGYDVNFSRGEGPYLYDAAGRRYLDLLSGFGVFAVGRNHPSVISSLKQVLEASLPGLVQMDVALLAGVLAERLLSYMPGMERVYFCNSGAEAVESAIKFARMATRRSKIVFCKNSRGNSRHHIMDGVKASLERLQLDHIDLYQIHGFDPATPIEETVRALDTLVKHGHVRYVGVSNWAAWQIMKALGIAEKHGLAKFESLQAYYSVAGRDLERELIPMLQSENLQQPFQYFVIRMFRPMSETRLNTVNLADRMANSAQFKALYAEGMGLVEETANYLDGPGRTASKALPRMAGVLYAAESMRLTTRLMQMASWLLLQRAVNNGEMDRDQVRAEKSKVRLDTFHCDRTAPGWADLPDSFQTLVERSLRIQNRVALLDREIYRPGETEQLTSDNENSVQAQQHLLKTVFSKR